MTFRKLRKLRRLIDRIDKQLDNMWTEMDKLSAERNDAVKRLRELMKDGEISC